MAKPSRADRRYGNRTVERSCRGTPCPASCMLLKTNAGVPQFGTARLIPRQQLGRRTSASLILVIDVGKRLPIAVLHNEACSVSSAVHGGGQWRRPICNSRPSS